MATVAFSDIDAWLLYCIPKPGGDLKTIVWCYTFTNRTSPPSCQQLNDCLSRGLNVGILEKHANCFVVTNEWYDRIHSADDTTENEIDSMLEFQDFLLATSWDVKRNVGFVLETCDYDQAVTGHC